MSEDLTFIWKPGKQGNGMLFTKVNGKGGSYSAPVNSWQPQSREQYISELCRNKRLNAEIIRPMVEDYLEQQALAGLETVAGEDDNAKVTNSQAVTKLANGAELFHCGEIGYATINIAGIGGEFAATLPLESTEFRKWLYARFMRLHGRPPLRAAIDDAIATLDGQALFNSPEYRVAIRVAEHEGAIYLDLADAAWRAVRITPHDWSVITNPPVKFLRRRGMKPLPLPVRGGGLPVIRDLLNAREDRNWYLMVAWLLGTLHPQGPYPLMAINGEPSSGKSTTSRMLRRLIDPNKLELRSLPRDERDLAIQASNAWVCGFDNISGLSQNTSDALCRLATGGGFSTRKLHSDDDEILLDAKRPVIINGIEEDVISKSDLATRALHAMLPRLGAGERRSEASVWRDFEHRAPEALGGILDGVVSAMANLEATPEVDWARMSDHARWVVSAETSLGWTKGTFKTAFCGNLEETTRAALSQSDVGRAVRMLLDHCSDGRYQGTYEELLDRLEHYAGEKVVRRKDWPRGGKQLSGALRRLGPVLRQNEIDVVFGAKEGGERIITLENTGDAQKEKNACATNVPNVQMSTEEEIDLPFE